MSETELTLARESLRRVCDDFDGSMPPGWAASTINIELALSWAIKAHRFMEALFENDPESWNGTTALRVRLATLLGKTKEYVTVRINGDTYYIASNGNGGWQITGLNGKPPSLEGCSGIFATRANALRMLEAASMKNPG